MVEDNFRFQSVNKSFGFSKQCDEIQISRWCASVVCKPACPGGFMLLTNLAVWMCITSVHNYETGG